MLDWLLIFAGGLLASGHCIGMCGGFVLTLGSTQKRFADNLRRQLIYCAGRIFLYSSAGAVAGFLGWRMALAYQSLVNVQSILALTAGALLVIQGLHGLGLIRLFTFRRRTTSCPIAASFGSLLLAPGSREVFVAGLLNGILPCGLVYAYLVLASASGNLFLGMLTMFVFGLGTIPSMVLAGLGGTCISLAARHRILQVAALCLVLTGLLSMARGFNADHANHGSHFSASARLQSTLER